MLRNGARPVRCNLVAVELPQMVPWQLPGRIRMVRFWESLSGKRSSLSLLLAKFAVRSSSVLTDQGASVAARDLALVKFATAGRGRQGTFRCYDPTRESAIRITVARNLKGPKRASGSSTLLLSQRRNQPLTVQLAVRSQVSPMNSGVNLKLYGFALALMGAFCCLS